MYFLLFLYGRQVATHTFELLLRGACTLEERIPHSASCLAEKSVRSPRKLFIFII